MNFHLAEVNKKNIGDNEDKGKGNKVKEKGNDFQKKKKKEKGKFHERFLQNQICWNNFLLLLSSLQFFYVILAILFIMGFYRNRCSDRCLQN